ncbi:MAG: hypothetical protein KDC31_07085 [Saprospiraceae bacterium]|nr:hypothetical protein [Candidatus Parvibacillus calidus]MBX2938006.1 hypothetical protein [Saprospiraceae bacterium]MBX7179401.1 hypothetical protein [Saprospiraceae bacterium]MCB0591037.1 hypothetical protein [Saprospiraceae bacterium]MCC7148783.1 hypothetical protein [Saprospiraceae bacterium]
MVTSIPAVVDEVAEVPMLGVYSLKGIISGNWTDAKYQALGVFLPGVSKTTIKTLSEGFEHAAKASTKLPTQIHHITTSKHSV